MNLTEFSYNLRKYAPYLILFIVIIMIFYYSIQLAILYYKSQYQPVTSIYINPIFDKIKKPSLKNSTSSANFDYIFDTIDGVPVTATATANVYFLPLAKVRPFGYREKTYLMAKAFGFDTDVIKETFTDETKNTVMFSDGKKKLTINISNFNFSFEDLNTNEADFQETIIPPKSQIENTAIDFLRSINRYPEELSKGKTNVIYHRYSPGNNTEFVTENPSDANVVEVDFYRPDIENFMVVTPKFFNSQNFIIMVFNEKGSKVIRAQVHFFEKLDSQFGIYPVISGETAWNDLNNGKGLVVSSNVDNGSISIKKMNFGYLDPDNNEDYLQPVYIFIGTNNFVAYVPAVSQYLID